MCKASTLYQDQGGNFNTLKAKVSQGPGAKPEPDPEPITSFTGGEISNESKINAWEEEVQRVVQAYSAYADQSGTNAANWPEDYGTLGLPQGGADFTVDVGSAGAGSGNGSGSSYVPAGGGSYGSTAGTPAGYSAGPGAPGGYTGGAVTPAPGSGGGSPYADMPAASDTSTGTAG